MRFRVAMSRMRRFAISCGQNLALDYLPGSMMFDPAANVDPAIRDRVPLPWASRIADCAATPEQKRRAYADYVMRRL